MQEVCDKGIEECIDRTFLFRLFERCTSTNQKVKFCKSIWSMYIYLDKSTTGRFTVLILSEREREKKSK